MLVKMMHDMSELLLGHCLNDACELNEQDRNILENVISNLGTCALKDAEQMSLKQKCLFPQSDSGKHAVDSPEIQQVWYDFCCLMIMLTSFMSRNLFCM